MSPHVEVLLLGVGYWCAWFVLTLVTRKGNR